MVWTRTLKDGAAVYRPGIQVLEDTGRQEGNSGVWGSRGIWRQNFLLLGRDQKGRGMRNDELKMASLWLRARAKVGNREMIQIRKGVFRTGSPWATPCQDWEARGPFLKTPLALEADWRGERWIPEDGRTAEGRGWIIALASWAQDHAEGWNLINCRRTELEMSSLLQPRAHPLENRP